MSTIQVSMKEVQTKLTKKLSETDWYNALYHFITGGDFLETLELLAEDVNQGKRFVPKMKDAFNAFSKCKYNNLKVVILGQDPYPYFINDGNDVTIADGMAFSCSNSMKEQPSLTKIFDEVKRTVYPDTEYVRNPDLSRWAEQGVLLLNSALTTELAKPGTHQKIWEPFITFVFDYLYWNRPDLVFILMGKVAGEWEEFVNTGNSIVITTTHPVSACYNRTDWNSNDCFNRANKFLESINKPKIIW